MIVKALFITGEEVWKKLDEVQDVQVFFQCQKCGFKYGYYILKGDFRGEDINNCLECYNNDICIIGIRKLKPEEVHEIINGLEEMKIKEEQPDIWSDPEVFDTVMHALFKKE